MKYIAVLTCLTLVIEWSAQESKRIPPTSEYYFFAANCMEKTNVKVEPVLSMFFPEDMISLYHCIMNSFVAGAELPPIEKERRLNYWVYDKVKNLMDCKTQLQMSFPNDTLTSTNLERLYVCVYRRFDYIFNDPIVLQKILPSIRVEIEVLLKSKEDLYISYSSHPSITGWKLQLMYRRAWERAARTGRDGIMLQRFYLNEKEAVQNCANVLGIKPDNLLEDDSKVLHPCVISALNNNIDNPYS